jgi:hypothetical protein
MKSHDGDTGGFNDKKDRFFLDAQKHLLPKIGFFGDKNPYLCFFCHCMQHIVNPCKFLDIL